MRKTLNQITRGWAFAHHDRAFCNRPAFEVAFSISFFLAGWSRMASIPKFSTKCYDSATSLRAFCEGKKSDFKTLYKIPVLNLKHFWSASYFKRFLTAQCSAGFGKCSVWEHSMLCRVYRVAKMHHLPCFNGWFSAKEPYTSWLFCGKRPST